MRFERIRGSSELGIKRDRSRNPILIISKVKQKNGRNNQGYEIVSSQMDTKFGLIKCTIDEPISFNGYRIEQDSKSSIQMDMTDYLNHIQPLHITRNRRKRHVRNTPLTRKFLTIENWLDPSCGWEKPQSRKHP